MGKNAVDSPGATPDQPAPARGTDRLAGLDLIRGIAVMGILAANIVAFGQPMTAYMYPDGFTVPHSAAEDWMWVAQFVLVDGKMRGLFTLLFGAGMLLFLDKAWAKGATRWLQFRRLLWLGLFGLLHFFFIWRGDILFTYAVCGLVALLFARLSQRKLLVLGLIGYVLGALVYLGMMAPLQMMADTDFGSRPEVQQTAVQLEEDKQSQLADGASETSMIAEGRYGDWVAHNFSGHAGDLSFFILLFALETVPLMLIGMALFRYGLFGGEPAGKLRRNWAWAGLIIGSALTLAIALWAKAGGYTYYGTLAAFMGWSPLPRLLVLLGLVALLAPWAAHARGWLAERVRAAGRAAFTNYLGTSVVMMLVFHGWAGGMFGRLGRGELYLVMLGAWVLMLLWSKPWLERYRYGPLEWLWRCLTYGKVFALRR